MKIDLSLVVLLVCWAVSFTLWQYEVHKEHPCTIEGLMNELGEVNIK